LARKAWKDADIATNNAILASIYSKSLNLDYLDYSHYISCSSLKKMDTLWSEYSDGRFGFKAQKEIWVETGNTLDRIFDLKTIVRFYSRVGWTEGEQGKDFNFIDYDSLIERNNPEKSKKGNLPRLYAYYGRLTSGVTIDWFGPILARVANCNLSDGAKSKSIIFME
jgi:hypothetical protein